MSYDDDFEPKILNSITENNAENYLEHLIILAFLESYEQLKGNPISWVTLISFLNSTRNFSNILHFPEKRLIQRSLRSVLQDFNNLGIIEISSQGYKITEYGKKEIKKWNPAHEIYCLAALNYMSL